MAGYPVNEAFRREVRERALAVARELTLQRGWQQVRFVEVADAVGVSRPTMYSEFGSKAGLGEALVLRETGVFLDGMSTEIDKWPDDISAAAKAALRYTVLTAHENPLVHAVLTNVGDTELLMLMTSRSGPVLALAVEVLGSWFRDHFPERDPELLTELIEALVRLTLSHLVQPTRDLAGTLQVLENVTDLLIERGLS